MNLSSVNEVLIRTLPTPNPMALKFVINMPFKTEGKATFSSPVECSDMPLLRDVFALEGIKQIHLYQNTMTVTHSGELTEDELSEKVSAIIESRYPVHNPEFGETLPQRKTHVSHQDPLLQAVEEILDRTIRPGLQADGGDIEVVGLEGEELQIIYQGACGGCPSSLMGTLDAIQGILRQELDKPDLIVTPI